MFYPHYDSFLDPVTAVANPNALTLVRALELILSFASNHRDRGASGRGECQESQPADEGYGGRRLASRLRALTEGSWGNDISVDVVAATTDAFIEDEQVLPQAGVFKLKRKVKKSDRDRVSKNCRRCSDDLDDRPGCCTRPRQEPGGTGNRDRHL